MSKILSEDIIKKIKIVGINGKAGSGKDFIADAFYSDYFRISFADHFKCDVVGKGKYTYEQVFVTKEPEVRKNLQIIGTEEGRDVFGENVWINCVSAWIRTIYEKNKISKFIVADVRFDNEAEFINDIGGYVLKIQSDRENKNMDSESKSHSSESGINDKHIIAEIINNKVTTVDDLRIQLDVILKNIEYSGK